MLFYAYWREIQFRFKRLLNASDRARFLKHSHRIRTITMSYSKFPAELFQDLGETAPDGILFPNIRRLRCIGPGKKPNLLPWIGPRLCTLDYAFWQSSPEALPKFPLLCPELRYFTWNTHHGADAVSALLCQYDDLEYINAPALGLSIHCAEHLTRLQNLRHLNWTQDETTPYNPPGNRPQQLFPRLEYWRQKSNKFAVFLRLASQLAPQTKLRIVHFIVDQRPKSSDVEQFYAILASNCHQAYLREVTLWDRISSGGDCVLHYSYLSPLLSFPNITNFNLTIRGPCTLDLSAGLLPRFASFWPSLRSFHLTVQIQNVSTDDFLSFVQSCSKLRQLSLKLIDGIILDKNTLAFAKGRRGSQALRHLMLWETPIQDPDRVAASVLALLCPQLQTLQYNNLSDDAARWKVIIQDTSKIFLVSGSTSVYPCTYLTWMFRLREDLWGCKIVLLDLRNRVKINLG